MKLGEFNHPVIQWSMYDDGPVEELTKRLAEEQREEPTREEFDQAFDSQVMELGTNAPPGIRDFIIRGSEKPGEEEVFHGIVVNEDGFEPHLTAHAIYIAQAKLEKPGIHHVYIEMIQWDEEKQRFAGAWVHKRDIPISGCTAMTQTKSPAGPEPDPLGITTRLAELKELKDGWADGMQIAWHWGNGYSKAPDPSGLDWLDSQLHAHCNVGLPVPYIYPTPAGGAWLEWSMPPSEATLEIDLAGHSAEWRCINLRTGNSTLRRLDPDIPISRGWLASELKRTEPTRG